MYGYCSIIYHSVCLVLYRLKRNVTSSAGSMLTYRKDIAPKLPVASARTHLATTQILKSQYKTTFKRKRSSATTLEDSAYHNVSLVDFSFVAQDGMFSQAGLDVLSGCYQVVAHRKMDDQHHRLDVSSERRGMKTIFVDQPNRSLRLVIKDVEIPIPYTTNAEDDISLFQDLMLVSDLLVCKSQVSKSCSVVLPPMDAIKELNCKKCNDVLKTRRKSDKIKTSQQATDQYRQSLESCGRTAEQGKRFARHVDLQLIRSQKQTNAKLEPE